MNPSSSTSDNDIPAKVIKACKQSLSKAPLFSGKTPIYNRDSKLDPANDRPIFADITLIKIFERVMHKNLVCYLKDNKLLSNKQHGFCKGGI